MILKRRHAMLEHQVEISSTISCFAFASVDVKPGESNSKAFAFDKNSIVMKPKRCLRVIIVGNTT